MGEISDIQKLKSGDLDLLYSHGSIRQIRIGEIQIVNSIYGAVRDRNWGTVPGKISNEILRKTDAGFMISMDMDFAEGEILFKAGISIEGVGNKLVFKFTGTALSSFLKNRIGLCILHPIKECKGNSLEVIHPDGSTSRGQFPVNISPDQPFVNISGMKWQPGPNTDAELLFEGDIFEMEDQRNWSDASFKSYCTPLDKPFPVQLDAGSEIKQSITLLVSQASHSSQKTGSETEILSLAGGTSQTAAIPAIGISRSSEPNSLNLQEAGILKEIPFSHYRVDLRMNQSNWEETYQRIIAEQDLLGWPLELALHFDEDPLSEVDGFIRTFVKDPVRLKHLLIYDNRSLTVDPRMQKVIVKLKAAIPGIPMGGGTYDYFTELNRNRPDTSPLDFLSFTICPQVHAFDKLTLVENLEAQSEIVSSAWALFQKPVYISAITLKQRFNMADHRQHTLFAAGWTLGSIKQFSQAGAASLTYYETVGKRGIFVRTETREKPSPTSYIFKEILGGAFKRIRLLESSHPLRFDGFVLENRLKRVALLMNYTKSTVNLTLKGIDMLPDSVSMLSPEGWLAAPQGDPPLSCLMLVPEGIYKIHLQ